MSQAWAEKELAGIDLGDARLNKVPSRCWIGWQTSRRPAFLMHATAGLKRRRPTGFWRRRILAGKIFCRPISAVHSSACKVGRWCCAFRIRRSWTSTASRPRAWAH
jgi:hypothetical protein